MSKKLVVPTLETQQKYPLFYAEATKTINDIIEHISKERGIYTSNIEPDPKEHTIWFNTNFNAIYFYNEKTKSFIPITGGGGGDLSTIITLVNDLREEIGDSDDWNNDGQYNTIYAALDGLQTQIQNINSTAIPIYTVSNKNELFNMDLDRGIYKVVEEIKDNAKIIKNYYILTVGGLPNNPIYKLYGSAGIFEQQTIDNVKQFVKVDFDVTSIQEIIGSGKFGTNLEDAENITDAINILSSIIGETDSGDADISFMNGYSILTYLAYINDIFDINSFNLLVGHDEENRKVAKMFTDLQTLVNNIKTLVGDGNFGPNFIDGDDITICLRELGKNIGYFDYWNNNHQDENIFAALDRIDSVTKELDDKIKNTSSLINGGKMTYSYKKLEQAMEHPIVKNLPAGTYNISINVSKTKEAIEPFGVGSIVIRNTNGKLLSYYPSNNIPLNLQFSQPVNIYVTPFDKDYLDYCITEDGGNFQYDDASFVSSDVDYTFDNIWVISSTDVSDIKDRLDIIEDTILNNSEFVEVNEGDIIIENNKKYKINNKQGFAITKNSDDIITNFTILSIYSTPPTFEDIPIIGFSDTYTYEEVVLLEYNNGYITVSKILEKGDIFTTLSPIIAFDSERDDIAELTFRQLGNAYITETKDTNIDNYTFMATEGDVIIPKNLTFANIPDGGFINALIMYGSYTESDIVPYAGGAMNQIINLIVYSSINVDNIQAYVNRYIIGNGGTISGYRIFSTLQLQSFTENDVDKSNIIGTDTDIILTNCSANIDAYMIANVGLSSPLTVAYFGNNTNVYIHMGTRESIVRIFENIPEYLEIDYDETCSIEFYTKEEHIEEFKTIIKTQHPNTNILNNITFYVTEFITTQNGLFKETIAINKGDEIAKYIHV